VILESDHTCLRFRSHERAVRFACLAARQPTKKLPDRSPGSDATQPILTSRHKPPTNDTIASRDCAFTLESIWIRARVLYVCMYLGGPHIPYAMQGVNTCFYTLVSTVGIPTHAFVYCTALHTRKVGYLRMNTWQAARNSQTFGRLRNELIGGPLRWHVLREAAPSRIHRRASSSGNNTAVEKTGTNILPFEAGTSCPPSVCTPL
jgi:hypothetical protein